MVLQLDWPSFVNPNAKLIVAICTRNRPDGLSALLRELLLQSKRLGVKVPFLVIDNSVDGNARWVTKDSEISKGIQYLNVTGGGLSNARNSALDAARKSNSAIAFIDDDEVPDGLWLETAIQASNSDEQVIYAGPVVPDFGTNQFDLALPIQFWERPTQTNGSLVRGYVGDGNIIYPSSLIKSGIKYSLQFAYSGGQDTDFLMRARAQGYRIKFLTNLSVRERVPAARQTLAYLKYRAIHSSCAWVSVQLANNKSKSQIYLSIVKRSFLSICYHLIGSLRKSSKFNVQARIYAASARGSILGLQGKQINRYAEYQTE